MDLLGRRVLLLDCATAQPLTTDIVQPNRMSRLTQIEKALRAMDSAKFQQLCDTYLTHYGYRMNPYGRAIGVDKVTRGTPDSWALLPNGKYLFAEYTTQITGVRDKLLSDFAKCMDPQQTGVPVDKVHEVMFIHTSVLSAGDEDGLIRNAQAHGVIVTQIGISPLAHDILQKYPDLARDYLDIEVDTGQIVLPEEFVRLYGRNALATPLDTEFQFREEEVEEVLSALETDDLVVVSGRSGVGKSRLTLECARRFIQAQPEFQVRCIFNRGADLFEDLRVHFVPPGKYLIIVDDANRLTGFDYILQFLLDQRADRQVKIITTVRDYALPKVTTAAQQYGGGRHIEVTLLKDEQIGKLVKEAFGIQHPLYLERIAHIAHGNPRLAIMAAQLARAEQSLGSIRDVSALYDRYYSTIRQDLDALGDRLLLRVAGVVAFYRTIDRTNQEQMEQIATAFGIAYDAFWEAAERLHEMELLDMYETEIVKFSDQVLSTYLFYLAFIRERDVLQFSTLLEHFYPRLRHRIMDALYPVLSAFGNEFVFAKIGQPVERAWSHAIETGDENKTLHLIDDFWFVRPGDALLYVQDKIAKMEDDPPGQLHLDYKTSSRSIPEPSVLSILGSFRYAEDVERRIALDLLLEYATKRTSDLPNVLRYLVQRYGFRHVSYAEEYSVERDVVNALVRRLNRDEHPAVLEMFLVVAEAYLHTNFHTTETGRGNRFHTRQFGLLPTPEITQLRGVLWDQLFVLWDGRYRARVLSVLGDHARPGPARSDSKIVAQDAQKVIPFFSTHLNPEEYVHCVVVQDYLDRLTQLNIPFPQELRSRFREELYDLAELLDDDLYDIDDLDRKEAKRVRQAQLDTHFSDFDLVDYEQFFRRCVRLFQAVGPSSADPFRMAVNGVLGRLAERNPVLFGKVLQRYVEMGNPLDLPSWNLVSHLVNQSSADRVYEILSIPEYAHKRRWLFDFYASLPSESVTHQRLNELYDLYTEAAAGDFPYDLSFLMRYAKLDPHVFVRVVEMLTEKAKEVPNAAQSLGALFTSHNDFGNQLPTIFANSLDALKRAYLVAREANHHTTDYDGHIFNMILDLDPHFAAEYVDRVFESHRTRNSDPDPHHDHRNYSFIWRRVDHESVMDEVVRRTYELEAGYVVFRSYIKIFFKVWAEEQRRSGQIEVSERQDAFLANLIARCHDDIDFLAWLFETIATLPAERRRNLIAAFLSHNDDYKAFKRLSLAPSGALATGSFVPVYQRKIEFMESLLPLLNDLRFLRHRQRVQHKIEQYRKTMERANCEDFSDD
jgi:hypothetical protein